MSNANCPRCYGTGAELIVREGAYARVPCTACNPEGETMARTSDAPPEYQQGYADGKRAGRFEARVDAETTQRIAEEIQQRNHLPKDNDMSTPATEREAESRALSEAAAKQREYERQRGLVMDEAVLVTVMLKQRLPLFQPAAITDSDLLVAVATVFAALWTKGCSR